MKIHAVVAELVHADGQTNRRAGRQTDRPTDKQTDGLTDIKKLVVAFRIFSKKPKIFKEI